MGVNVHEGRESVGAQVKRVVSQLPLNLTHDPQILHLGGRAY